MKQLFKIRSGIIVVIEGLNVCIMGKCIYIWAALYSQFTIFSTQRLKILCMPAKELRVAPKKTVLNKESFHTFTDFYTLRATQQNLTEL